MADVLKPYRADIELFPVVENAKGVRALAEIALASDSTTILGFGAVDLVAETGSDLSWDALLYTRSQVVLAAAEAGIECLDTVYIDIGDEAGLREESKKARSIGFAGKAAIHPSQVAPINDAFSPTEEEVAFAQKVVDATAGNFSGAIQVDGKMIDEPVIIAARRTLARRETNCVGCDRLGTQLCSKSPESLLDLYRISNSKTFRPKTSAAQRH